jgi:hypothetical protein
MALEVDQVLLGILPTLAVEIPAEFSEDSYAQGHLQTIAALLHFAAIEYERGADTRIFENAEMRRIFASAADSLDDPRMGDRLRAAAATEEADFRMSTLNAANDGLRELLIELHAFVEERETPAARRIDGEIWDLLRSSTERRSLELPTPD